MATEIIHEHDVPVQDNSNNGMNMILGIIAVVAIILVALYFFRGGFNMGFMGGQSQTTPQVNVPDKVDVNVNKK